MNFEKQPPQQLDPVSQSVLAQTPLHFACYRGDGHLLDMLIGRALLYNNNNGEATESCIAALICEEDALNGWTPAHWAAFYGQLSCLMKLHIKPSWGFDTPSHRSNTSPLHVAAQSGAVLCLKWLLQCGSSKNRQDFMGETALHKAAKAGNTDCAAMLVGHGSLLDMKNHRGLTPAEVAEQSNHTALAQYLRRAVEQAEYGSTTKSQTSPMPISDLSVSKTASSPQPSPHCYPTELAKFPNVPDLSKEQEDKIFSYSYIIMNGEDIHNSCAPESCEMEQDDAEMSEKVACFGVDNFKDSSLTLKSKPLGSVKRSFDDTEDDDDVTFHKRMCFVPSSHKSHEERYGDTYNNNVISSYNAVLAMRVEPMTSSHVTDSSSVHHESEPASPVLPQSSIMDHQESLIAQQGYDSTFMQTVTNAFH